MILIYPSEAYLGAYGDAIREDGLYRPEAEQLFSAPESIIKKAYDDRNGIGLKPGYVASTTLWLVEGGAFIGEVNIRHRLTPALMNFGGHIGYEVRYSECGKGYGTEMLALAMDYAAGQLGIKRALLTCDDDNIASYTVIERNGGVLENKVINQLDMGAVTTRRYWIAR